MANFFDQFDAPTERFGGAIANIESGGKYDILGPVTRTGDRAYGKYQVMGANIPEWSEAALGRRVVPDEFLRSPEIQDAVFNHRFGSYVQKYGPEGAARAWFAGEGGMDDMNRKDQLGTSVAEYGRRFSQGLPTDVSAQSRHPVTGRPILNNPDGSIATEESITVTHPRLNGGRPTNIPSIWGGQRPPFERDSAEFEDWAVEHALRSGKQFQSFGSIDEAVSAAKQRSNMLGQTYRSGGGNFFDQFDGPNISIQPTGASFKDRFSAAQPAQAPELDAGLRQRAQQMTMGAPASPQQAMVTDFMNQASAASQRTTPIMSAQAPNLLSTEVFETDAGTVMFRDPSTGKLVETDQNKHVALRDPADGQVKVYARSSGTDEGMISSAGRLLMPGLAAGAPTARAARPVIEAATRPRAAAPTREQLFDAAEQGYETARNLGVQFDPGAVGDVAFGVQGRLLQDGLNEITAKNTHALLERLKVSADNVPAGTTGTFSDVEAIRRGLGKIAQGGSSPDSLARSDAAAAAQAIEAIDNFLASPGRAVVSGNADELSRVAQEARGNYAAAKRSERVGRAEDLAELQAGVSGSGANIDNALRQRVRDILKNPKELRGFSKEEIVEMRKIALGTPGANAARLLGKLAPTGVVSSALSTGTGFVAGGGIGAVALPVTGFAFKKLADTITASKMAQLDELIRSRSPLAKQIEASLSTWNEKTNALSDNPTAPKVAQFVMATRNLVTNLKDAGIALSPSDFIKTMQGSMKSAAEDEKPKPEGVINR